MPEGYAVFVSGTSSPIAVRVYNFAAVELVSKVISGIRYISSVIVDDDILVVCIAGCKYGALHLSTFGGDEVRAMNCIKSIIETYPDIPKMDALYERMSRPIEDRGDVYVYIPSIRVSSDTIVVKDESSSLTGDHIENDAECCECYQKNKETIGTCFELLFVGSMVLTIVGLMVTCVVVYMITDG